jgi:uncharacterized protein (TIGR02145 family)
MRHKKIKISAVILFVLSLQALQSQTVKDIDGNVYKTVTIGTQIWMAENLKTTKYNDGTAIPLVTDDAAWVNRDSIAFTTRAYYWYDNDITYKNIYGALYNGYTVKTGKLCPSGWHVPTDAEWSELTNYLGGEGVAGGKLKEASITHWETPNTGATNETGFNALPGGYRFMDGTFQLVNGGGNWWSSTDYNTERTWFRGMNNNIEFVIKGPLEKPNGVSVRCVKD